MACSFFKRERYAEAEAGTHLKEQHLNAHPSTLELLDCQFGASRSG
jgi:hypothetical protein